MAIWISLKVIRKGCRLGISWSESRCTIFCHQILIEQKKKSWYKIVLGTRF